MKSSPYGQTTHAAFLRKVVLIHAGTIQQAFNKIWARFAEMNDPDSLWRRALLFCGHLRADVYPRALCPRHERGIPSHHEGLVLSGFVTAWDPYIATPRSGVCRMRGGSKCLPNALPVLLPVLVQVLNLPQSHFVTTKKPDCLILMWGRFLVLGRIFEAGKDTFPQGHGGGAILLN